ncbi:MAG: glycosyltransferase family 2 protein [Pyrinomonadaceae bacterium]
MIFIFYILAVTLIYFSYKSFRGGIDYLNYFKRELAKPQSNYTPFATIIAPCKGLDEGLSENLAALLQQDYPAYEVIFVVDDKGDPAVEVIEDASRKNAKIANMIVAPKATDSSQKIENLREAVRHISKKSQVFVFVDSDARPAQNWLRHLVAPLADKNISAATGYRWFISKNLTFASEMRSIWNASIASALGANTKTNFCWGGSMAIRRDTFERLVIREKWHGTLSDDFVVTRSMKAAHLPIYFVPQALTTTIENCTLQELLEFTTRQMKITRVYASKLWLLSFFGSGLFNLVVICSLLIVSAASGIEFFAAAITLLTVGIFSLAKSTLRLKAVMLVLSDYRAELKHQYWTHNILTFLTPALFLYNCVAAALSRTMTWRGVTYKLTAANKTEIVIAAKR